MSVRRRTYPEVLETILTGLVQSVSGELHPFPPGDAPPFAHVLERSPVARIISVYGSRNGQPARFSEGTDYLLAEGRSLVWQAGSQTPDAGTLFSVNYTPQDAQNNQTDIYPGSVLRTLTETVALEISRLYAQLEAVHQSAYLETATGSSLDKVVDLLDVHRVTGNHPAGEVTFTRATGTRGAITIPAGTRITTADGEVEYETTATVTVLDNQKTARVPARDLETANDPLAAADLLTVLPIPIAGIASVTNASPTTITTQAESDEELRSRARNVLVGSERATLAALKQAVERQGVSAEVIEDPTTPGLITVNTFSDQMSPELLQRIRTALNDARPAGVLVAEPSVQAPAKIGLQIRLTTAQGLLPADLRAIQESVRKAITDYLAKLPARSNISLNKITGLVLAVPGVEDMRLLGATRDGSALDISGPELDLAGEATVLDSLQIADPALPTLLSATITYAVATPAANAEAIRGALNTTITYLNDLNQNAPAVEAAQAELDKRVISWGKLLHAIPLPGKPEVPLQSYDAAPSPAALPATADPYTVTFAFTMPGGFSLLLAAPADAYTLTPSERLTLGTLTVAPEAANG